MKRSAVVSIIVAVCAFLPAALKCDNDPQDEAKKVMTLLSPTGGAGVTYTVGDTVRISWKVDNSIPDSAKAGSVCIRYSLDGGTTFPQGLATVSVPADTAVWTSSYLWTVATEHISSQFVLKIYDYTLNSPSFAQSAPFIVAP